MPMPTDQAGWRQDPDRPGSMRWWNGLGWSDARRAADTTTAGARAAATEAIRGSTVTPQQVARTTADRTGADAVVRDPASAASKGVRAANPFASAALPVGLFALTAGGFGLPIAGLVLSVLGLVRGRRLTRGGGRAGGTGRVVAGLVLSLLGLLRSFPTVSAALPDLLQSVLQR